MCADHSVLASPWVSQPQRKRERRMIKKYRLGMCLSWLASLLFACIYLALICTLRDMPDETGIGMLICMIIIIFSIFAMSGFMFLGTWCYGRIIDIKDAIN